MSFGILEAIGIATAAAAPEATAAAVSIAPEIATTGSFIGDAAALGLGGTAETAVGTGTTIGELAGGVGGGAAGESGLAGLLGGSLPVGTISNSIPGVLGALGNAAGQQVAGQAISQGVKGIQNGVASAENRNAGNKLAASSAASDRQQVADANQTGAKLWGHAEGGPVALQNGDWVVPADVLSSIGNGSTNAGAQFLNEYFGLNDAGTGSPT